MEEKEEKEERAVIVCTDRKSVYFGYTTDPFVPGGTMRLRASRQCIRWGTTAGVPQLAATGPTSRSLLGAEVDLTTGGLVVEYSVTPQALEVWKIAKAGSQS